MTEPVISMVPVLKPRISALLQGAVAEIRGAGVEPTVEEIIWLHSLCERQVLPSADDPPQYLALPVVLHPRVTLFPLTLEATMWLEGFPRKWWPGDKNRLFDATAYAMARSGTGKGFIKLTNRTTAMARIIAWVRLLPVSEDRLAWGVLQLLDNKETVDVDAAGLTAPHREDAEVADWGEVICQLCGAYHLAPQVFLQMPVGVCVDMLRRAPVPGGASGMAERDNPVAKQAFIHFRLVLRHIINLHKPKETPTSG